MTFHVFTSIHYLYSLFCVSISLCVSLFIQRVRAFCDSYILWHSTRSVSMCDEFMKNDGNSALLLMHFAVIQSWPFLLSRERAQFFCNQCFVFLLFQSQICHSIINDDLFLCASSLLSARVWSIGVCVIVSAFSHLSLNSFSSIIAFSFSVLSSSLFYEVIIHSLSLALCIIYLLGQF